MSLHDTFRAEVDAYLATTGQSATAFGRASVNDPGFVFALRRGRSPSARVIDRVRAYMAANPPTARPVEEAA